MKRNLTAGCLFLLGLPAMAIEAPGTSTPIPPQRSAQEAAPGEPAAPAAPLERVAPPAPDFQDEDEAAPEPQIQEVPAPAVAGAYMGVGGAPVPDILAEHLKLADGQGIVIRTLDPDGPAAKAGLSANDIITRIDGKDIDSHDDLRQIVSSHKAGDEISVDYINRGDAKNTRVSLAEGRQARVYNEEPLDQLMQEGMEPDQARRIRDVVERNLRAFERANRDIARQADAAEEMQRNMQERMQRMMGSARGIELRMGNDGNGMNFKSSSTIRLVDDAGSIVLRSEDDSKKVQAYDKEGKLQWEGPYNTDDDKKAMPDDVRERVEKLSPDMNFKNGLRLNLGPRR